LSNAKLGRRPGRPSPQIAPICIPYLTTAGCALTAQIGSARVLLEPPRSLSVMPPIGVARAGPQVTGARPWLLAMIVGGARAARRCGNWPMRAGDHAGQAQAAAKQAEAAFDAANDGFDAAEAAVDAAREERAQARTARYAARQAYERASVAADRVARRVRELSERLDKMQE